MNVVKEYPPNYEEIAKVFNVRSNKNVCFTHGDTLYNPSGNPISQDLMLHETVHAKQQTEFEGGADAWWTEYLIDPVFRLKQELEAYSRQYKYVQTFSNRKTRRVFLQKIAKDLASPIYGSMVSKKFAEEIIEKEVETL